jgi:hypothetical protein
VKERDLRGIAWHCVPIGKDSDSQIAKVLGVSASTVRRQRNIRGIPAWKRYHRLLREKEGQDKMKQENGRKDDSIIQINDVSFPGELNGNIVLNPGEKSRVKITLKLGEGENPVLFQAYESIRGGECSVSLYGGAISLFPCVVETYFFSPVDRREEIYFMLLGNKFCPVENRMEKQKGKGDDLYTEVL